MSTDISPKTAEYIGKYVKMLVRRQPKWLRDLFKDEKIAFVIDESKEIILEFHIDVDMEVREHACKLIMKYLDNHPSRVLNATYVN